MGSGPSARDTERGAPRGAASPLEALRAGHQGSSYFWWCWEGREEGMPGTALRRGGGESSKIAAALLAASRPQGTPLLHPASNSDLQLRARTARPTDGRR